MPPAPSAMKASALTLFAMLLLNACQTGSQPEKEEAGPAVFFPIPPDRPRVQYVSWFAGGDEVESEEERGAFASFIVGKERSAKPRIVKPYGLAARDGVVYVCDARKAVIGKADWKNRTFSTFGNQGIGKLIKPVNLVVDKLGFKFVADAVRNEIVVFGPKDKFIRAYKVPGDKCRVVDVGLHGNQLFVMNNLGAQIVVMDRTSGKVLRTIGKRGAAPGEFSMPSSLAVSRDGFIYVCDPLDCRIQKLTLEGKPVWSKGGQGFGLGTFGRPRGIRIGPDGVLYITDAATAIVQMWNSDGRVLMHFGGSGNLPGSLVLPTNVAVDESTVACFRKQIHKDFSPEYMLFVASQYGRRLVSVYAFGQFPEDYVFSGAEFRTVPIIAPDEEQLGTLPDEPTQPEDKDKDDKKAGDKTASPPPAVESGSNSG